MLQEFAADASSLIQFKLLVFAPIVVNCTFITNHFALLTLKDKNMPRKFELNLVYIFVCLSVHLTTITIEHTGIFHAKPRKKAYIIN